MRYNRDKQFLLSSLSLQETLKNESAAFHSVSRSSILSVRLFLSSRPEPSAFLGNRGGAGPACRPAAGAAEEGQGSTVVSADGSGVGDRWPQGREEDLGPGARSTRWEASRRHL